MLTSDQINQLTTIKSQYEQIDKQLSSQSVWNDRKSYHNLIKRSNQLNQVVTLFNQFLQIQQTIEDLKQLLNQDDQEIIQLANQEILTNEKLLIEIEQQLSSLLLALNKDDDQNVIVEIRGAAGGDEANIFAADLYKFYLKYAQNNHWKVNLIDFANGSAGGFSQIVFAISGQKVYSKLKFESGVHRVQRVPMTETQGRMHTSTVTVSIIPEIISNDKIEIKASDLKIDTYRSSGAGGQSVNTTDSAVRITHLPTKIVVTSQAERSQIANKELALRHLKAKLYDFAKQKQNQHFDHFRKLAGTGARSEKIRTYNFAQDRITDHRINCSYPLKQVFQAAKLDLIINKLKS